tara:strand:+ start:346 stop:1173 length:828 start_codon:yes stop_codon:yes gene_type:complete
MIKSYKFKKNIYNLIEHPILTLSLLYKVLKTYFFENYIKKKSKNFFIKNNLIKYIQTNDPKEIPPEWTDLKRIYDLVRSRKPHCTVEFGSGVSTIVIALALKENELKDKISGRLFSVEGNQYWMENTQKKIPEDLEKYVQFHFSKAVISNYNGQVASVHESLPNVSPNLIYLDGPSPDDVSGNINGISFQSKPIKKENGANNEIFYDYCHNARRIVSADPLLYESTAPSDFFIFTDRRYTNANFLEKNLKYNYKIKKNITSGGCITFEKKYQPYP